MIWNRNVVIRNRGGSAERLQRDIRRLLIGCSDSRRFLTLVIEETIEPTTWLLITGAFASRQQIGVPSQRIHVDIGGCGHYLYLGKGPSCGFSDAVNLNDKTMNADAIPEQAIPALVLVEPWSKNPRYPLAPNFADYVTMQSAPLEPAYVREVARILQPSGMVGL